MKGEVLKYLNHYYIWGFLKKKIKSALVYKEFMESLIDSCTCRLHCAFISSINDVREIHIVLF